VSKSFCAAATASLLAAMVAQAQAQANLGMGQVTCSQYVKAARNSDMLYYQASNWLLGYLSGMNAATRAGGGAAPAIALSPNQALKSAGDYCEAHPAGTVADAAAAWQAALPQQAAKPPERSSGSFIINLDTAPDRKPLLDRR
jgi:hypothetical protein